ncbi:preprotein translocase subunit YajC [Saccharopolyspora sp. CA-218241]|uniref:preprotein translocase subunit YajC n=1 Tax=Saccharopolyspora sp. CA-218241 TaxID=3240027 RepID=UPI003D98FE75
MESLIFPLLIVLLAVPLFLQARKQKRAMQEQQKLQNSLTAGDRVMTTSGVFGTVVATADDSIELELAPGLTTTWVRAAVREKVVDQAAAEQPVETADADEVEDTGKTEDAGKAAADDKAAETDKVAEPEQQKAN